MLLGLGGNQGGGGGEGVISCTCIITFHLVVRKEEKNVTAIRSYQFFDTRLLGTKGYVNVLTDN